MLSLRLLSDLVFLHNQFQSTSPEKSNDSENVVNSKYYNTGQIVTLKFQDKHKFFASFHINKCSLNINFDDIDHLFKCSNKAFEISAVSKTRITKQTTLTTNINLKDYSIEFIPTGSSGGGMLLYIASHLSYKTLPDPDIYKANQLESTFVAIIYPEETIILIGCSYEHPNKDVLGS